MRRVYGRSDRVVVEVRATGKFKINIVIQERTWPGHNEVAFVNMSAGI